MESLFVGHLEKMLNKLASEKSDMLEKAKQKLWRRKKNIKKAESKAQESQDLVDTLLKQVYPFLSEGFNWTSPQSTL